MYQSIEQKSSPERASTPVAIGYHYPVLFYRQGSDHFAREERVWYALGPDPLEDARHLLPPLGPVFQTATEPAAQGPHPQTEFVVDLVGGNTTRGERVLGLLSPERRAALGFVHVWGRLVGSGDWTALEQALPTTRYDALAFSWQLSALLSEGLEAARELGGYESVTFAIATSLGRIAAPRETPQAAAARGAQLLALRMHFGRSIEMRLLPTGRPFAAREVWRAVYALGLQWGDLDLFHWHDPETGQRLWSVSAVGQPGTFLPERAVQGEGINGIALGFELPRSPAPLPAYDRMALALAYLRHELGGRPTTTDGRELDADGLDAARDALEAEVVEMARAGIAPGSEEAARLF